MSETLQATLDVVRALKSSSGIKVGRSFEGFFSDRLVQAVAQPNLVSAMERLSKSLDASVEFVGGKRVAAFAQAAAAEDAPAVLAWMRAHPKIVAMICMLRDDDDYRDTVASIEIPPLTATGGKALPAGTYDMPITVTCLSELAHGGDQKAGNATLFRRVQVLSDTGGILELPIYGGNALRGQMRDLLADDLITLLGLTPSKSKPPVALWFFHALYAGGVLEGGGEAEKAVRRELGDSGAIRADGVRTFRGWLPALSLLGVALGNRVLPGRINVGDLRPRCTGWGTGETDTHSLYEWTFLTRREDHEDHEDNHSMIASTEALKAGTVLDGGIDWEGSHHSDLEASALGRGLALLQEHGMLGAENRRGMGRVEITVGNAPDQQPYLDWMREHKGDVLEYLTSIGACTL